MAAAAAAALSELNSLRQKSWIVALQTKTPGGWKKPQAPTPTFPNSVPLETRYGTPGSSIVNAICKSDV